MAVIGSLSVKLGLVTVEWDRATAQAKQQAKQLQTAFNDLTGNVKRLGNAFQAIGGATGLGAIGFGALTQQTLAFADAVDDLAKGFDLTVAKTLQFRNAIQTSGGSAEGATRMLTTLFGKIQDARAGNEVAIAQFERIGISLDDLMQMTPDQSIDRVFQSLNQNVDNTFLRIKATKDLLGKTANGVEISSIAEQLKKSNAEYARQAQSVEKLAKLSDNLKTSLDNLKLAFANLLSPFIGEGLISIEKFEAMLIALGSVVLVNNIAKIVVLFKELRAAMEGMAKASILIESLKGGKGGKGLAGLAIGAAAYFGADYLLSKKQEEEGPSVSAKDAMSEWDPEKLREGLKVDRADIEARKAKVALLYEQIRLEKESRQNQLDALVYDKYSIQLRDAEIVKERAIAEATAQRKNDLKVENLSLAQKAQIEADYAGKVTLAQEKYKTNQAVILAQRAKEVAIIRQQTEYEYDRKTVEEELMYLENTRYLMSDYEYKKSKETVLLKQKMLELEQQIADIRAQYGVGPIADAMIDKVRQQMQIEKEFSDARQFQFDQEEARRTSWLEGWNRAIREYIQMATDYSTMGANAFNGLIDGMNNAIENFVKTGKANFGDFARSIIQDIIAMILKFQAMQIVMQGLSLFGFKIPTTTTVPSISNFVGGVTTFFGGGRATGGYVDKPVLVGENGPELFVPSQSGSIVPNAQMSSWGNNAPQVVYNGPYIANMNAIDTQSATQFLAKNKMAVWAANQSASRSMPVSR